MTTDFEAGARVIKKWGFLGGAGVWLVCTIVTMFCSGMWVLPFFLVTIGGAFAALFFVINTISDIVSAFKYVETKKRDPRHYSIGGASSATLYWVAKIEDIGAKMKEKEDA